MLRASTLTTQARAPAEVLFQRLLEGTSQYTGREFFRLARKYGKEHLELPIQVKFAEAVKT